MEQPIVPENSNIDDIENNAIGDGTVDETNHPDNEVLGTISETVDESSKEPSSNSETKSSRSRKHDEALNDIIYKALEKVKEYFYHNEIEEHTLAEFMFKMLTLNVKDINPNDFKMTPDLLDQLVEQMIENRGTVSETDRFNEVIENLFGPDAAKAISEKLCTEKIDEIVERLLGEDTKKLICEKLDSENLDELLNKLIDEKLKQTEDPGARHPNFDEFIEKILGKETEEFIRKKLEIFLNDHEIDEDLKALELD